ncbi:hypothetical protein Dform_01407 [Dehalogenimonas formicexedens]|uniref:DUF2779 domain-containing protein n=1 Tax=Dehalogenimonas formicexedens TaxID=1839801 RepID=A0A1P8F8D6_9CHLR|nr:DUF2779 domain-containing protein [Dehalogenimonas formicexedens]APV44731.1 hypothetical protein Dform_01407 [Dehalogenimonas formicexedens]
MKRRSSGKLLTKSKFMAGLQCPRYLWIYVNDPSLIPQPDLVTQHTFDQGHEVGEVAKRLFTGGIDMSGLGFREMLSETSARLADGKPIFEAAFQCNQLYARVDILNPSGAVGWDIVEVKSATEVKDENIADVAFQKYVVERCGITVNRCHLVHINREYIKQGPIDPAGLLISEDITERVSEVSGGMADMVEDMLETIAGDCPDSIIGRLCDSPYDCPLKDECWSSVPEHPVSDLYRIGSKMDELFKRGITSIRDIPEGFKLNEKQLVQKTCVECGQPHIERGKIASFLGDLKYPHHFLDFETFGTAIPIFNGIKPFQAIPFQFSLHTVESQTSGAVHRYFLARGPGDPRIEFIEALKTSLGEGGTIIVYNQGFEQGILEKLAETYAEYREWIETVIARMADLIIPFRNFHYYHPEQRGSASLKHVLPSVTGIRYEGMNIAEGQTASLKFMSAAFGGLSDDERTKIFEDLLEYCGQDTYGMVRIVEELWKLTES